MSKKIKDTDLIAAQDKVKKRNKIIALSIIGASVLAAIIVAVVLIVNYLGGARPIESSEQDAAPVGKYGEHEVRFEELRYVTLLHKQSYAAKYGEHIWDDPSTAEKYRADLEADVMEMLKANYVILTLCDDYGIDIDSRGADDYAQKAIEKIVDGDFEGDMDKYKAFLSENNLTDALLRLICKTEYLEAELLEAMVEEREQIKYNESNYPDFINFAKTDEGFIRTTHVFWKKGSDADKNATALKAAQSVAAELSEISDEGDRYDRINSHIGNTPIESGFSIMDLNGIYLTRGQMGDEYETASFSLSEYETSDVVETPDGYYVIMRLPKDEKYIEKNGDTLLSYYQYAVFNLEKQKREDSLRFEPNDHFKTLDLVKLK